MCCKNMKFLYSQSENNVTFMAPWSRKESYWAGVINRPRTTSSSSPLRAAFKATSRGCAEENKWFRWGRIQTANMCWFQVQWMWYLADCLLVSGLDLLALGIAPADQCFNDCELIHTWEQKLLSTEQTDAECKYVQVFYSSSFFQDSYTNLLP